MAVDSGKIPLRERTVAIRTFHLFFFSELCLVVKDGPRALGAHLVFVISILFKLSVFASSSFFFFLVRLIFSSLPSPHCFCHSRQVEECLDLLVAAGRVPEACFMARTYLPSAMGRLVALWKKDLSKISTKARLPPLSLLIQICGVLGL